MTEIFITSFVTLFLIIDPIGLMPFFIALTSGNSPKQRRIIGLRACIIALVILTIFTVFGEKILHGIGISMPAFRIAGGLLLFLTAVEMLFEKRAARREQNAPPEDIPDPSVFPLATPLIAGPGAIAAVILSAGQGDDRVLAVTITLTAMGSVVLLALALFLIGGTLERLLGKVGINVITRVFGMLLAALAVQFVVDGMQGLGVV